MCFRQTAMWFEARKQEKKIRVIMIDHKKRAERRKQFYEKIVSDPICLFNILTNCLIAY